MNLENFPTNEIAKQMLSYVTEGWYDRSYVGKWMYQVMGMSMEQVQKLYEELPLQMFVKTATWGLCYHEQKYGQPIRWNLGYEERRRLLFQWGMKRAPMTPYNIEQYLKRQLGFETEVSDVHDPGSLGYAPDHPNRFRVVVWNHNINTDLDYGMVEKSIRQVNQSHTVFTVEHRQNFECSIGMYSGALVSEWVGYEIRPRQINRDMEGTARTVISVTMDMMIFEEIRKGVVLHDK